MKTSQEIKIVKTSDTTIHFLIDNKNHGWIAIDPDTKECGFETYDENNKMKFNIYQTEKEAISEMLKTLL